MKRGFQALIVLSVLIISLLSIVPIFPNAHAGTFPSVNGKIAFASGRDGNFEIYVMNADGTDQTRLTNDPAEEFPPYDWNPSWSPDGTKIAFESNRDGTIEIYVMNAHGTDQTRLTHSSSTASSLEPSWSPDGTKIAFESDRDKHNLTTDLYVMNADGTDVTRLTNSPATSDYAPSWSPDGTKIAFVSDRDGNTEIYVMNADGTDVTRLTNSPSFDVQPDWGPQPSISGENALVADKGVISLGETTKLIQKIDASSGLTGTLVSLRVLEAD